MGGSNSQPHIKRGLLGHKTADNLMFKAQYNITGQLAADLSLQHGGGQQMYNGFACACALKHKRSVVSNKINNTTNDNTVQLMMS